MFSEIRKISNTFFSPQNHSGLHKAQYNTIQSFSFIWGIYMVNDQISEWFCTQQMHECVYSTVTPPKLKTDVWCAWVQHHFENKYKYILDLTNTKLQNVRIDIQEFLHTHFTSGVHLSVLVQMSFDGWKVLLLHIAEQTLGGQGTHLQRGAHIHGGIRSSTGERGKEQERYIIKRNSPLFSHYKRQASPAEAEQIWNNKTHSNKLSLAGLHKPFELMMNRMLTEQTVGHYLINID